MFKIYVVLVHVSFTVATVASTMRPNPTSSDTRQLIQKSLSMNLQKTFTESVVATQSQIESTAAVSGAWFMYHTHSALSCFNSDITEYIGNKMNVCVEDYDSSTSSSYSIYTCTQDFSTGDVVLQRTTYSDAACTADSSVKTPGSFSNTCTSGKSYFCDDTNDAETAESMTADGIFLQGFFHGNDCTALNTSALVAFIGGMGCGDLNLYFGKESAQVYLNSDCTGGSLLSLAYSDYFPTQCAALYDDDNAEDDDDGEVIYDGLYVHATFGGSDDDDFVCFHVDSKINYKGVEYTYDELKAGKEPECTVPHSPHSKGVVITTSCDKTVRVTDTHLLSTTKGFQLAYSLKAGDVLFGDYDSELCTVKSVEKEKSTQQYFGLNCVHSEVLASGLRASTFGDFHTLPSWYMTYVGSVLGTETASTLGDYITDVAEWYYQK